MIDSRASQMLGDDEDELMNESNQFMKAPNSAQYTNYSLNTTTTSSRITGTDMRQKNELRKFEKERREQFEKMKKDAELLEQELGSMKDKVAASNSRNKVLANENKNLKDQVKVMLEKANHDNELIEALMKKHAQLKANFDNLVSEKEKASRQVEDKSKDLQIKTMQEKNTIDQLKAIIAEREKKVKFLQGELELAQKNSYGPTGGTEFFLNNTNSSKNDDSIRVESPAKTRAGSGTPTLRDSFQRNASFNERDSAGPSRLGPVSNPRPPSSGGLNAKLIEQKKELARDYKMEISELTTLHKTSEIERVRLLELVKSLQKRVEDLNEKAMEAENRFNEQRRKSATMEKQMEKLKLQEAKPGMTQLFIF